MHNKKKLGFRSGILIGIGTIVLLAAVLAAGMALQSGLDGGYLSGQGYNMEYGAVKSPSMSNGASMDGIAADMDYEASYDDAGGTAGRQDDRKLVRTASVRVETKSYDTYADWLDGFISSTGGYAEDIECVVSEAGTDPLTGLPREYRTYSAAIRVPADQLDTFLSGVESQSVGKVVYQSENVRDITVQYNDTEAHLESIRIEQQRLQELMAQAETVEDIISIEDRLSYIRYEIESYERQVRSYDSQVEYASVRFTLQEVLDYTNPAKLGFFARCWEGLKTNFGDVGVFIQDAAVYLFSHIPAFACIAVLGFAGWKLGRKVKARRRKRQAAQEDIGHE